MTNLSTTDVLICGAGAAGLALAIDLARRGVDFELIEKAQTPFGRSRGKGIQPRTLEVFEDFDIVDRIAAAAGGVIQPSAPIGRMARTLTKRCSQTQSLRPTSRTACR